MSDGVQPRVLIADLGSIAQSVDRSCRRICITPDGTLHVSGEKGQMYRIAEDISEAMWDRTLDVNLKGMFLMSRAALPHIRAAGGGTIVNLASGQGSSRCRGWPRMRRARAGSFPFTHAMALDHAHEGIRVVAICPGTIDSAMVRAIARAEGGDEEANVRRYGAAHPPGRIGTPADIGAAAVFLASDAASFITGADR